MTEPPALVTPTAEITAKLYEADGTSLVRTLPHSFNRQWQDRADGPGNGSLTIPATETAEWSAITPGRIIRFAYRGVDAFSFQPRQRVFSAIPKGDNAPQVVTFDGPGLLQTLDDALVLLRPSTTSFAGGVSKRLFGWQCPEFDDSGWAAMSLGDPVYTPAPPRAWPSPFTTRVWKAGAGDGSTVLARRNFTLAGTKALAVFVSADDGARVWLDGVPLGETDMPPNTSIDRTWRWIPLVEAGAHTLAIEAIDGGGGDRWFACAVYGVDSPNTGTLDTGSFLFQTAYLPSTMTLEPWMVYEFDGTNRPGLTWGSILTTAVTEAQARGQFTGVTLDFDEDLDSNGNAWPVTADFITDIGRSVPELIAQGAESEADTWMDPAGLVIHSTRWRERGNFWTVPVSPPKFGGGYYGVDGTRDVNLSELTWTTDLRADAVTIVDRHRDGYGTHGMGPERFADLGDLDASSAGAVAATMVTARADDAESVTFDSKPANGDEVAYDDWTVGDAVSVPQGAPGAEANVSARVVSITVADDSENHHSARVTPELTSALAEFQTITQRRISRQRAGVSSDAISAPETLGTGIKGGVLDEERLLFSKDGPLSDGDPTSLPVTFPTSRSRPFRFVTTLRAPDTVDVDFDFCINGTAVHSATIPAYSDKYEGFMGGIVGVWPDIGTVVLTNPSGLVAEGLTVEIYLAPAI